MKTLDKSSQKLAILIVDDHPPFRRGIAQLFSTEPDLEVSGEAADAERALRAGARGYVMKREALDCVLTAVRSTWMVKSISAPACRST